MQRRTTVDPHLFLFRFTSLCRFGTATSSIMSLISLSLDSQSESLEEDESKYGSTDTLRLELHDSRSLEEDESKPWSGGERTNAGKGTTQTSGGGDECGGACGDADGGGGENAYEAVSWLDQGSGR
jgi:hypothetical protein